MKKCSVLVALFIVFSSLDSFAQWAQPGQPSSQPQPMYDMSYRGPMNIYGQPVYSVEPKRDGGQTAQGSNDGVFPMAATGLEAIGRYFWSYMPAPVRGEPDPLQPSPGSGYVVRQIVPGSN